MNKTFYSFLFFLLGFCCETKSQTNLIYNGDFEIYDTCPRNPSTPGDLQIEHCKGWTAPTKIGTSDYFNVCNNLGTSFAGIPKNLLGFQQPYNGEGYCGFFASIVDSLDGQSYIYREYLQTKLTSKLEKNKQYQFRFHISNCGESSTHSLIRIGALFSANNFVANTHDPIVTSPQVVNTSGFISDTLNWFKIEGDFIADGTEEYVTIGYFEAQTIDTLNNHYDPFNPYYTVESYYYVDGVELAELPCKQYLPNVFSPNGDEVNDEFFVQICDSGSFQLNIYSRWGALVFKTADSTKRWNGTDEHGLPCVDGSYFYVVETETKKEKGFIQLVR